MRRAVINATLLLVAGLSLQAQQQAPKPTITVEPESSPTWPAFTNWVGFVSATDDPLGPFSGSSVHFRGWQYGGSGELLPGSPSSRLVYRYKLEYPENVKIKSVKVQGAAFQGDDPPLVGPAAIRLLDSSKKVLSMVFTGSGNVFASYTLNNSGPAGKVFYLDEFTTSTTWRYRSNISVTATSACQLSFTNFYHQAIDPPQPYFGPPQNKCQTSYWGCALMTYSNMLRSFGFSGDTAVALDNALLTFKPVGYIGCSLKSVIYTSGCWVRNPTIWMAGIGLCTRYDPSSGSR